MPEFFRLSKFFVFFFVLSILVSCKKESPVIHSIDPKIGKAGETLTVTGEYFGKERGESYVTIAGMVPTNSSYLNWQEDQISLKLPESGESGLIYVHVNGRKSNGALFSNQTTLPQPPQGEDTGPEPRITSIEPRSAPTGSLISITGNNFGSSRGRNGVLFSWNAETRSPAPEEAREPAFIEVAETEFGYELWNDREIRLRIPDGAASGNLKVRTFRGDSRPVFFEISGKPGTKIFRDKRSYTITYSVDLQINEADKPNTLYLWIPLPAVSAAQRNIELLSRNVDPFIENYRGTSLYKLDDLEANSSLRINFSWQVEVYAVETSIQPQSIRQDANSPAAVYTRNAPLIPSDDPLIKKQSGELLGRERNPYIKARRIYEWFIAAINIQDAAADDLPNDAVAALEAKQADPYTAALLYCAMLRSAGVPCLPVSGVLINRSRQAVRHYWAEFWIDGFGWIPVDPALGAGAVPPSFAPRPGHASFYFGSMDNQRIAFSRGQNTFSQMDPRGRAVSHTRSYALQNLWEEAVGGIDSYSSLWGDVAITGMYVQ
ncbi:MAG: IPT/TIG domain-containing protein [Treponema sp.]|jgi:transglutaminase-like putative cysteine protease|nr:IPT/TIG domain-containing protein [Treponema sp.]